jgi:hypothetical protein
MGLSGRCGACSSFSFCSRFFSLAPPRHAVDAQRGVPFQREVTLFQKIGGDMLQQRCEPYTAPLGDEPVRRGCARRTFTLNAQEEWRRRGRIQLRPDSF